MASSARQESEEGVEPEVETNPCAGCPGACCSFHHINISYRSLDKGERYDSMLLDELGEEGALNQLLLEDGTVPEMDWYVVEYEWEDGEESGRHRALIFKCGHLTEAGMCGVYEDRPEMCRSFECEALTEDDVSVEEFIEDHTWEDGLTYADHPAVEMREVTERVREIIGRAEL